MELDEHLAGAAIQHREVQGQESKRCPVTLTPTPAPRFQAYFKKGLRYLTGGVKTGLSHYVEDKSPKLFQVKVGPQSSLDMGHPPGAQEAHRAPVLGHFLGNHEQGRLLCDRCAQCKQGAHLARAQL